MMADDFWMVNHVLNDKKEHMIKKIKIKTMVNDGETLISAYYSS